MQVLGALGRLHAYDVVHNDLKPANIMIDVSDHVRVIDFVNSSIDRQGAHPCPGSDRPGTLNYQAPETLLALSGMQTTAVDMWAAGCVLAELASKSLMFDGHNALSVLHNIFALLGGLLGGTLKTLSRSRLWSFHLLPKQQATTTQVEWNPDCQAKLRHHGITLLEALCRLDANSRVSAIEARSHAFFWPATLVFEPPAAMVGTARVEAARASARASTAMAGGGSDDSEVALALAAQLGDDEEADTGTWGSQLMQDIQIARVSV